MYLWNKDTSFSPPLPHPFQSPHPQRLSAEEAHRALKHDIPSETNPTTFTNLFENFEGLKAFAVDVSTVVQLLHWFHDNCIRKENVLYCFPVYLQVSDESDAVVFVATPAVSSHTIINTGNPEPLVSAEQVV